jgi:AcrR family transcriptional regulator
MKSKAAQKPAIDRQHLSKGMLTRASILKKARMVFKTVGFYGASVSEITRQSNVSILKVRSWRTTWRTSCLFGCENSCF